MQISEVNRIEMVDIDGSGNIRYFALIDGKHLARYTTDGIFRKHLTTDEWIELLKSKYKEK